MIQLERWISLGVLCPSSTNIDGELIPRMQEQFIYQLPLHKMYETEDDANVLIFWDKIPINSTTNMNQKIREIQNVLNNRNVIVIDSGEEPTFWKNHGDAVIALMGGASVTLLVYFL